MSIELDILKTRTENIKAFWHYFYNEEGKNLRPGQAFFLFMEETDPEPFRYLQRTLGDPWELYKTGDIMPFITAYLAGYDLHFTTKEEHDNAGL